MCENEIETLAPIGKDDINGISNTGSIGANILEKINVEAFKKAQELANFVADEVRKFASDPLAWPISFTVGENGQIPDSSRIIEMLQEILEQHGLLALSGPDYFTVDLMSNDVNEDDIDEDGVDEEEHEISHPKKVLREVPDAESMFTRAKEGLAERTKITTDYIARRIQGAAEDGLTSVEVSVEKNPINGHAGIVKRVCLYLKDRGYIVKTNIPVKSGEKLDYSKVKTIVVSWDIKG